VMNGSPLLRSWPSCASKATRSAACTSAVSGGERCRTDAASSSWALAQTAAGGAEARGRACQSDSTVTAEAPSTCSGACDDCRNSDDLSLQDAQQECCPPRCLLCTASEHDSASARTALVLQLLSRLRCAAAAEPDAELCIATRGSLSRAASSRRVR
jgi:hypothetical protein